MKTDRISRIIRLITALQSGENYTMAELAEMVGVSRRTVFRDLRHLQRAGIPYCYHSATGGYSTSAESYLPPLDLKPDEALSLLMLVRKARNQVQLPYSSAALLAALKIENNLPANIREYVNNALSHVSAVGRPPSQTELLDEVFSKLQQAITKNRKTVIRYEDAFAGEFFSSEFCPYHLINNGCWHATGFSERHQMVKNLRLNCFKEIRLIRKYFVPPKNFDIHDYIGNAWAMNPEGRLYHVRLWLSKTVASAVAETLWHSSQKITFHPNGSAIMEFRLDGLREIKWWILGYGDQIRVLEPQELKAMIVHIARNMVEINEPDSQSPKSGRNLT